MAARKSLAKPKPKVRETKAEYDPAIFDALVERWRATHHLRSAAAAAGVSHDTVQRYLQRGAEGEEPFASFALRWRRAEGDWVTEHLLYIRKAFAEGGQWQAAAWDLERHLPDEFGKKERLGLGQDPTARPLQTETKHSGSLDLNTSAEVLGILAAAGAFEPALAGATDPKADELDSAPAAP